MVAVRTDRLSPIVFGATPIRITAEGWRHYEGTATIGDVVLPYSNPPHAEFRPAIEVADEEAVRSMEGVPLTYEHPEVLLDPDTAKEHTEGAVLAAWREEGEHPKIRVRVVVYTRPLQEAIEGGMVELSPGYKCDPEELHGEWRGTPYHVVQRRVRYNHLAVVDRARTRTPGGEVARLDKEDAQMMKQDQIDLVALGLTPEGAELLGPLLAQLGEADREIVESRLGGAAQPAEVEVEVKTEAEPEEVEPEDTSEETAAPAAQPAEEASKEIDMEKMQQMIAAEVAKAIAAQAKPPAADKMDADKGADRLDAAIEAKLAKKIAGKLRAERADYNMVRKDSADLLGDAGDDDFDNTVATMIAEVKRSTPAVEAAMKRAVSSGRMDDARDLYRAAVESRRATRLDDQAAVFGGIAKSMTAHSGADKDLDLDGIDFG